jgi:SAM-dependent methyltransferase
LLLTFSSTTSDLQIPGGQRQLDGNEALERYFELQQRYCDLYAKYLRNGINRTLDLNDKENQFGAEWEKDHYFSVGADALRIIVHALLGGLREPPTRILDFPCGSGRIGRHLRAFFPNSQVVSCDLYEKHVKFCVDVLGTEGIISNQNFELIDFSPPFDLIYCGSLVTHLPDDLFRSAIRLISRSLTHVGLAVITTHGRHSEHIQDHKWKYIEDHLYAVAASTISDTGFGYVDYNEHAKSSFGKQARYGISLSRPHWTMKVIEEDYGVRVLGYAERALDDHQDVLVLGRPGIND